MSFTALVIFGIILILITLYIIVYVIYPGSGNNNILPNLTPLSAKKDIYFSDVTQTNILASSGSTVMGYFKLNAGDRTVKYSNNYVPLLYIDNNWFLEISPAPIGKDNVAARFRVQTNDAGELKYEMIDLPEIPKQKWIFITILRDGRRFDIIYDNKIVASHRLDNYPVIISSPVSIGNNALDGNVINVIVNNKRLNPIDVERERLKHVDTNNTVLQDSSFIKNLPGLKLFGQCPSGLPCDTITKPPNNNLLQWKTPYA